MIEAMPSDAVCDAGPLIHLDELGCLDVLEGFARIVVPISVCRETERHRPQAIGTLRQRIEVWSLKIPVTPPVRDLASLLPLHPAETHCLALCQLRPNALLLTDDFAARVAAQTLGIRTHGTIGLLLRSLRRKTCTREEVVALLEGIPARSSLFIRRDLLDEMLAAIRCEP